MTDAIKRCSATETAACCCVDVGTVIDNSNCTASWSALYTDHTEAEAALERLTAQARRVESDPCQIAARFSDDRDGVRLDVDFTFSCEAETLIFQLGLR